MLRSQNHFLFLLLIFVQKYFIIILFLVVPICAIAQSNLPTLDELSFDIKYCGGAVYKHTNKVNFDPPPFSQEVEFSVTHRTYGKRAWERYNNCPAPSINFCFSQYGDMLGNAISIYPGIEWAVIQKNNFAWRAKVGGGIGVASERWTREDTLNNYLGSRINNFTVLQTGFNYALTPKIEIQAGGRMSHISNGAFRLPNFGINLFSAFVGVNYYPLGIQKKVYERPPKPANRTYNIGLRSSVAWGEENFPDGPLSRIYTQTIYVATPFKRNHLFFAGADIARNNKARSGYSYNMIDKNLAWAATATSIFVGVELRYGKVGIPFQAGIFTKKLLNQDAIWYQKFGFQYYFYNREHYFLKKLYAGPMLKSNKINADYIEFCLGAMF